MVSCIRYGIRSLGPDDIFGGYVFGEYDRTSLANNYWTINPGVEAITPRWDFHLNGYFPLGSRENVNAIYLANQLGIQATSFKGRQQFDQLYYDINEVAPGLDASIGYTIPHSNFSRVFGGGYYYFFSQAPELRGLLAGAEVPLNRTISLLFADSYDNVNKNTAKLILRV